MPATALRFRSSDAEVHRRLGNRRDGLAVDLSGM
jgi:hypothetical protein